LQETFFLQRAGFLKIICLKLHVSKVSSTLHIVCAVNYRTFFSVVRLSVTCNCGIWICTAKGFVWSVQKIENNYQG